MGRLPPPANAMSSSQPRVMSSFPTPTARYSSRVFWLLLAIALAGFAVRFLEVGESTILTQNSVTVSLWSADKGPAAQAEADISSSSSSQNDAAHASHAHAAAAQQPPVTVTRTQTVTATVTETVVMPAQPEVTHTILDVLYDSSSAHNNAATDDDAEARPEKADVPAEGPNAAANTNGNNCRTGAFDLMTREEKQRIATHLQDVVRDYQEEYVQYMKSHVYGNPPHDVSMSDDPQVLKMYKEPLPKGRQHVHALACKAHEPGLVSVDSKERRYCFGGAKLPGERVCDAKANDYTQLHDKKRKYDVYELYGKQFAFIPFFHRSKYTKGLGTSKDPAKSITAATQGSYNRLEHVQNLARRWRGPIAFSLLLDGPEQQAEVAELWASNPDLARYVDLHLAWRHDHAQTDPKAFYPINMLRNMALENVQTELVLVMDVDNFPNAPMKKYFEWVREAEQVAISHRNESVCPGLEAFVPPALEMNAEHLAELYERSAEEQAAIDAASEAAGSGHSRDSGDGDEDSDPSAPKTPSRMLKKLLVEGFYDGSVQPMHLYFGPAYIPQNHFEWAYSKTVDEIKYLTRFEPYYVARMPIPLFNETFVDRGGNKAQQAYEMYAGGYRFFRLPQAFIIDIPHEHNMVGGKAVKPQLAAAMKALEDGGGSDAVVAAMDQQEEEEGENTINNANTASSAVSEEEDGDVEGEGGMQRRVVIRSVSDEEGGDSADEELSDNDTKQATHDHDFIAQLWSQLHDYLPHRYGFHIPDPAVSDPEFRKYRRGQEKIVNAMWHLLSISENVDKQDTDDH